jgi:hypothetical protein
MITSSCFHLWLMYFASHTFTARYTFHIWNGSGRYHYSHLKMQLAAYKKRDDMKLKEDQPNISTYQNSELKD